MFLTVAAAAVAHSIFLISLLFTRKLDFTIFVAQGDDMY